MSKGSVVIYTGSTWHSGGANHTASTWRGGLNIDYNLAWLRQIENQYLVCPPQIAKHLPRGIQDLIGYRTGGPGLGYYDGGLSPKKVLQDDEPPINWADEWQSIKSKL